MRQVSMLSGGVRIQVRRGRLIVYLALLFTPLWILLLGAASAVSTAWACVASAIGLAAIGLILQLGKRYVVFEPEGLRFGFLWGSFLVRWDNIQRAEPGPSLEDSQLLLITLIDREDVFRNVLRSADPERAQRKIQREIRRTRSRYGCDLVLATSAFGLDLALVTKAIGGYVADVEQRPGLRQRKEIA
jgi:hypothetical protein